MTVTGKIQKFKMRVISIHELGLERAAIRTAQRDAPLTPTLSLPVRGSARERGWAGSPGCPGAGRGPGRPRPGPHLRASSPGPRAV
jgi:hypothetical protein